jgi:transcriptional regulator with XRE-family HTH domain
MKTKENEIGKLLLACRTERTLTLQDVAKILGMSIGALSNIERGLARPHRANRAKIEAFLRKHGYFPKAEAA